MAKHVVDYETRPLPLEGFVRLPQVLRVLGIGRTTFLDGVRAGRFPKPVPLGPRAVGWRVEAIRNLIEQLSKGGEI